MTTPEQLADILRRLASLITVGTVQSVTGDHCRVAIGSDSKHLTPPIKWIVGRAANRRDWSQLSVGEQVIVLSPSGNLGNAVALAGLYSNANPAPSTDPAETVTVMPDGAVFRYNHETHTLDMLLPSGGVANLNADLNVDGNIVATGDISDSVRSMAADRAIYNSHNHTGDSGGSTSAPGQQQ